MNNQPYRQGFLPWHISWLTVILGLLAIGTFIAISSPNVQYATPMGFGRGGGVMMESGNATAPSPAAGQPIMNTTVSAGAPQDNTGPNYYPYPYPNPDVPVTDTREFLKIYYNADMRTRDVPGLTRRVETTVRGYAGRIDQESVSPQDGYVSFVVPQSKYDAFRTELEGLVGSRFLTISISSQNLLPQKQSIEQQQQQANTALSDYQAARQKLITAHTSTDNALQAKINADNAQLATLRAGPSTPQSQSQIQAVSDDLASLQQNLANENSSYATQLSYSDANIKYAQNWQTAVQTQDQTLLDNIATVTGTVSIQWISLWEIALLYLPGYWIPAIFAALTILSYLNDRRRLVTRQA